jgi:hypothetical protein
VPEISVARNRRVASIMQDLRQSVKGNPTTIAEESEDPKNLTWLPEPEAKLSADFGQALFPKISTGTDSTSKIGLSPTSQPLFTPSVPGLTNLLSSVHVHGQSKDSLSSHFRAVKSAETPSLLYDFIAAPGQSQLETGQVPPSLHIQVRTAERGGEATLHKLSLGFHQYVHNVLLPEKAADVQFTRYGRLRLRTKTKSSPKVFREWLSAVKANIASGERLTAPNISIAVPKWTITGNSADRGSQLITYLFSGVQFRQVVGGQFEGEHVSYSTTQSGKMGAQGAGFSMYYNKAAKSADELLQDGDGSLTSFVERCLNFADTITEAAGQTLPIAKMLRPRSSESGRKQRRLEEQAAATEEDAAPVREQTEDDVMSMLDDAIEQDQQQPKVEDSQSSGEADIRDTILSEVSIPTHSEQITPSSDRSVAEEATDSASPDKSMRSTS